MNSSARIATGDGRSPEVVVSTIVLVLILEAMALGYTIVTTALPAITTEFRTTQGGRLLTAYIPAGAVAGPLCGKLADVHGKRKVMLCVLGICVLAVLPATTVLRSRSATAAAGGVPDTSADVPSTPAGTAEAGAPAGH